MQLIHEKMNKIFNEIGLVGVPKDKIMQKYNYKFRDIDSIMNTINPAFGKHNVYIDLDTIKQERIIEKDGSCTSYLSIRYKFTAEDGSYVTSIVLGEGRDNFDKSTAKAYSSALKTLLLHKFMIPTECLWKEEENRDKSFRDRAEEFLKNIETDLPSFLELDIKLVQEIYDNEFKPKIQHHKTPEEIRNEAIALFSKIPGIIL